MSYSDDDADYMESATAAAVSSAAASSDLTKHLLVNTAELKTRAVNSLPCRIEHDGPTEAAIFFAAQGERATFRGRDFHGSTVALPASTVGVVVNSDNASMGTLQATGTFNAFTVWSREPSERESYMKVLRTWVGALSHAVRAGCVSLPTLVACLLLTAYGALFAPLPFRSTIPSTEVQEAKLICPVDMARGTVIALFTDCQECKIINGGK
jgi:hypothetical protein